MKFVAPIPTPSRPVRRNEEGFIVVAMFIVLALMLIYVAASTRSLVQLRQELKLVEQKQVQRLEKLSTPQSTNTTAALTAAP
jgi:hypothetical protein